VCEFPREIGHQQETVENPSDSIIHESVFREGLVSTFMSNNPNSGHHTSLSEPISWPKDNTHVPRKVLNEGGGPEKDGDYDQVKEKMAKGFP
jgi:hypothetical protein